MGSVRSGLDTNGEEGTNRYCEFAVVGGKGEKVCGEAHGGFTGTAGGSGQEGLCQNEGWHVDKAARKAVTSLKLMSVAMDLSSPLPVWRC